MTRTPLQIAALVLGVVLLLTLIVALRTSPVHVTTAEGRRSAQCGISYYLFGTSDRAIESACRDEWGGHFVASVITFILLVGVAVALVMSVRKQATLAAAGPSGAEVLPERSVDLEPGTLAQRGEVQPVPAPAEPVAKKARTTKKGAVQRSTAAKRTIGTVKKAGPRPPR